jgi:hypothetical protein
VSQFQTVSTEQERRRALGLYAVLAHDIMDFIDMAGKAPDAVLSVLYELLATPNAEMERRDRELNASGADLVKGILESRKVPLPQIALVPPQHTAL